jgi:hypothetical protein
LVGILHPAEPILARVVVTVAQVVLPLIQVVIPAAVALEGIPAMVAPAHPMLAELEVKVAVAWASLDKVQTAWLAALAQVLGLAVLAAVEVAPRFLAQQMVAAVARLASFQVAFTVEVNLMLPGAVPE